MGWVEFTMNEEPSLDTEMKANSQGSTKSQSDNEGDDKEMDSCSDEGSDEELLEKKDV